jgi:hypothetical protein
MRASGFRAPLRFVASTRLLLPPDHDPSMRRAFPFAVALTLLAAPLASQEVVRPRPDGLGKAAGLHFVLDAALEMGGDIFLTVLFTDGGTQDIYAGQGGTFGGGIEYRLPSAPRVAFGATAGIKFVTTAADNADIKFTRIPLDLTARFDLNDAWWVAGGLTHHAAIEFDGDGFVADASFPGATGFTAEFGWKWISLTYTGITYDTGGSDLDASSAGVGFRWVFGAGR